MLILGYSLNLARNSIYYIGLGSGIMLRARFELGLGLVSGFILRAGLGMSFAQPK